MADIDEMYEDFLAQAANHFVPEETMRQERESQRPCPDCWLDVDTYPECCCW